jgi:hypothetical protein
MRIARSSKKSKITRFVKAIIVVAATNDVFKIFLQAAGRFGCNIVNLDATDLLQGTVS